MFGRLILMASLSTLNGCLSGQAQELTRVEFAARLAGVEKGASKHRVEHLLGKAEKALIVGPNRPVQRTSAMIFLKASEIWYFGTSENDDFPTLGQIFFDDEGKVIETFGGKCTPFTSERIDENSLRECLRLVHKMPLAESQKWDPLVVIKIVNAIVELGESDGLTLVREYDRISPPSHEIHEQIGLLLRVLYEVPIETGYFPELKMGAALFGQPQDLKLVPRFPIHLINDIPVLMEASYIRFVRQLPPSSGELNDWHKANGAWRNNKLNVPSISDIELEELKQEVFELARQYMNEPAARVKTSNVYLQLAQFRKQE